MEKKYDLSNIHDTKLNSCYAFKFHEQNLVCEQSIYADVLKVFREVFSLIDFNPNDLNFK